MKSHSSLLANVDVRVMNFLLPVLSTRYTVGTWANLLRKETAVIRPM